MTNKIIFVVLYLLLEYKTKYLLKLNLNYETCRRRNIYLSFWVYVTKDLNFLTVSLSLGFSRALSFGCEGWQGCGQVCGASGGESN